MFIAQHPLMSDEAVLLLALIVFGVYLVFQITALVLLGGKWKLLALPGLLCPLAFLLFFADGFIASRVILVSWVYTAILAIVAMLHKLVAAIMRAARPTGRDTGAKRKLSK